eukprot:816508-Amphidinium_carterae.1
MNYGVTTWAGFHSNDLPQLKLNGDILGCEVVCFTKVRGREAAEKITTLRECMSPNNNESRKKSP